MAISTYVLIFLHAVISAVGLTLFKASGFSIDSFRSGTHSWIQISLVAMGLVLYVGSFAIWLHIASVSQIAITFPIAMVSSSLFVFLLAVFFFQQPFTLAHLAALGFIGIGVYILGK